MDKLDVVFFLPLPYFVFNSQTIVVELTKKTIPLQIKLKYVQNKLKSVIEVCNNFPVEKHQYLFLIVEEGNLSL